MRIIHLINHCDLGHGNVHVAIDLACAQAEAGHDVFVACAGGSFEPLLHETGVTVLKLIQHERKPLVFLRAVAQLVKVHRERKVDVLHAHMMSGALIGYVTSTLTGTPLVTTVHNSFDRHSALMRVGHRVVAVSHAERDLLIKRGYQPDRVDVVINGPNNSHRESRVSKGTIGRPSWRMAFQHGRAGPEIVRNPCITTVCGLNPRKGVADLINAFGEVSRELPLWRLYIVGDGPDRQKLEDLARSLELQDSVSFLGSVLVPRPILEKSDIFVLASYADPCSLAVAEARGAGCAIIATAVGGTPELLDFGRAGKLVEAGNVRQLTAELRNFMTCDDRRESFRHAAKLGSEFFDVERVAADYESIYRKATIRRGMPARSS
jgi:glycosyltransferase involved in cell wall biosynthesis